MHLTAIFRIALAVTTLSATGVLQAAPPKLAHAKPGAVGVRQDHLAQIDQLVAEGLEQGQMSGCVVAIGRQNKLVFLKAYGHRQLEPERVPMTTDTVFDMASITKPVATATSIMLLLERGRLRLQDKAADHLPEFGQHGKEGITILQLLTHQGGLIPDNPLADYLEGPEIAFKKIFGLQTQEPPGTRFIYTDVGFILLGQIIEHLSGQDVAEFSKQNIFEPLGMSETGYLPDEDLRSRAAVTEQREGHWMQGEVHDPRAYALGGVAGHAGLFSTAEDLAVYAQMMLNRGHYGGVRILSSQAVRKMTEAYPVSSGLRGLGWDKQSGYSSNRSDLYSAAAFGHGGFTGTVLWIDPELELFVIFLSSRLHPDGKGLVNPMAARIGSVAVAAIDPANQKKRPNGTKSQAATGLRQVLTGIDILQRDGFKQLQGQRIGLITNHTGIDRKGRSTVEILHQSEEIDLVRLFSPEHGFYGKLDEANIGDTQDPVTGLKVYSLYGETRRPTAESLEGLDTLVFDIQDIGARFYTYISTMGYAMEEAAEHGKRFVVLDRPNPINGIDVAGPVLDAGRESFVGYHALPIRHGMTVGELALMFKEERQLDLDLHVIAVEGWRREDYFDATGLLWVNPSPNMRSLTQAILYPGIGLLETTNVSVGRGTDTPFELIGAPWIDPVQVANALNKAKLPGARFVPRYYTPEASTHKGQQCGGVNIMITNRATFEPLRVGLEIAHQLRKLYPDQWQAERYERLLGDRDVLHAVLQGMPPQQIEKGYQQELEEFLARRQKYLIYKSGEHSTSGADARQAKGS